MILYTVYLLNKEPEAEEWLISSLPLEEKKLTDLQSQRRCPR